MFAREIRELENKAKILGLTKEQVEIEKQKISQKEKDYQKRAQEEEEYAKSQGFKNFKEYSENLKKQRFLQEKEKFSSEKIVVPPPYEKKIEALEFTDPNIPGEIKIDASGKLLKRYFKFEGKVGSLIDQYDNFISYQLAEQIVSKTLILPSGPVTFENVILNRPLIKNSENRESPLYPQEARNNGYSYTADIYADMVLNKGTANEERIDRAYFGKIPVMIGSELDWITKKTEQERIKLGESINDALGYFIIKGAEKIVMIQEKLRANRIFVYNSDSKGNIVCKVTNNTIQGSTQITMTKGKKSGAFKLHIGFLGRLGSTNKLGRTITIFQVFRMLGVTKPSDMMNIIYLFTKKEYHKKIFVALQPSFVKLSKIGDDIEYISKKKGLGNIPYNIRKTDIMKDLLFQLFPQITADQLTPKLYMLSMMITRLAEYLIGVRVLDDRDSYSNKQLVTAGKSLELLFSSIWKETIIAAQNEIDEKKLSGLKAAQRSINPSFITDNFIESFTANNWGVQSSYMTKENITDILKRDSILSVYSHLTKINTPSSGKVKSPKVRMVQMSQLGYVDAAETPEGEMCLPISTPIWLPDGTWKPIGEIQEGDFVNTVNPITHEITPSQITKPFKFHTATSTKKMYKITTINGRVIEGTGDHPFLTERGWVRLDQLTTEDKVCICPLQDQMSRQIGETVILDEETLRTNMKSAGIRESIIVKHTNDLKEKGLLPLISTYKYLHIISRISGFAVADGSLSISQERSNLSMCFGQPCDAENYLRDIELLGFERTKVCYVENTITDSTGRETTHHTWNVSKGGCLPSLLIGLGSTYGKKTQNPRKLIPDFVMNGSNLVKREYVAGFQGGDGHCMNATKREDKVKAYNFGFSEVTQQICPKYVISLFSFMMQMSTLLKNLGIETTHIASRKDKFSDNMIVGYYISRSENNLIKYMNTIGYRYASTKNSKSIRVVEYLRYKTLLIQERQNLKDHAVEMYKSGMTIKQISLELNIRYRLAGSIIEYWREAGDNSGSLANPKDLIEYNVFCEQNPIKEGQNVNAYIYLKVAKIEEAEHQEVADFTTISENHSFIADGFVTHNCLITNTPVLMANGDWKLIENITEGDLVVSVNPRTLEKSASSITRPFTFHTSTTDKVMYKLECSDRTIRATGDHPFLTQYGWIRMDKLNCDLDKLCLYKNDKFLFYKIKNIEIVEAAQVCDFNNFI